MTDFFSNLPSWSEIKLRILENYLRAYLNKRGGFHPRAFYVDGFAGQGYYKSKDGKSVAEGSPVRMARFAQQIQRENRNYRLICLNIERNRNRCNNLREALAEFDPELVEVFCGTFQQNLAGILAQMKQAPAVFFLDPFGVVDVSPNDLEPLLQRNDTELLLNFNTRVLLRLAGSATSDAPEARGKFQRLSRTLGEDPSDSYPEWLVMRRQLPSLEWEEWTVRKYMQKLRKLSPYLKYGLNYPIRTRQSGRPKYYLVFASRSMDAFPIMNDFLCSEEDDLSLRSETARRVPGQMGLFPPVRDAERESKLDATIEAIHAYGLMHQGFSRKQVIEHFTYIKLGVFKQKHYRQMLERLVQDGRVQFGQGEKDRAPLTFL